MGRRFGLYYPDATDPQYVYVPSRGPLVSIGDGSDLGLLQQRTADGELSSYVIHPVRRSWVRPFRGLTDSDKAARETFFNVTRGLPLTMGDPTLDDFVTVKAVGQSLAGPSAWQKITLEPANWERVEEFEETFAVPTLSDAGQVRAGTDEFADLEIEKTFTFDTPYADDGFYLTVSEHVASDGNTYDLDVVGKTATGFTLRIKGGMSPGMGETLPFDYIAVHN